MKKILNFISENLMALISIAVTTLFTFLTFTIGWYWATILFVLTAFSAIVLVATKENSGKVNTNKEVES